MSDRVTILPTTTGGTHAGYHSLKDFDCKRRGYFRQVCHLEPEETSSALLFGTAIHSWKEAFYRTWEVAPFTLPREGYFDGEKWAEDNARGQRVITNWAATWAEHDIREFEVLALETTYQYDLGDGLILTVKPDAIVRSRTTGKVLALDTKTTSLRPHTLCPMLESANQATAYSLVLREVFEGFLGWLPDIAFSKGGSVACERPGVVYRTAQQLEDYAIEVKSTILDIGDRVAEIGHASIRALFPTCDAFCHEYFHPCSYLPICRDNVTPDQPVPEGYRRSDS